MKTSVCVGCPAFGTFRSRPRRDTFEKAKRLISRLICLVPALLAAGSVFARFDSAAWTARCADTNAQTRLRTAFADCAARATSPAADLVFPIEMHADGTVKSRISAEKAQLFPETGFIWASGVTIERFDEKGRSDGVIRAAGCVVDRNNLDAWIEGDATAEYGDVKLEGEGVYLSLKDEFVQVVSAAKIEVKRVHVDFGRML